MAKPPRAAPGMLPMPPRTAAVKARRPAIGFLSAWSDQYISARWTNALVFAILILVLVFRPQGLLGERTPDKM